MPLGQEATIADQVIRHQFPVLNWWALVNVMTRASSTQPYYSQITFTKEQGQTVTFFQNGNLLCQATGVTSLVLTQNGQPVCSSVGGSCIQLSSDLFYSAFTFPRSDDMTIVSVSMTFQTLIYQGRTKALHMASEKVQVMD